VHVVDFKRLPALPAAGELYLALGTTIRQAGSQAGFRAVDYDANLAVAQAAARSGVGQAGLVSALGADPRSRVFYSRVKGELEQELAGMPFAGLVIARPSLLVGSREDLGQPNRRGEELGFAIAGLFGELQADPGDRRRRRAARRGSDGEGQADSPVGRDAAMSARPQSCGVSGCALSREALIAASTRHTTFSSKCGFISTWLTPSAAARFSSPS